MLYSKRPAAELITQEQRIEEAYLKLSQDVSHVALVGPRRAVITALDIEGQHTRTRATANGVKVAARSELLNDELTEKLTNRYFRDRNTKTLDDLKYEFIEHGRRDLGTQ